MSLQNLLLVLIFVGSSIGFPGDYIPKSYYVIDHDGHKSDVVYFRSKRDVELFPLLRIRRNGGSSSSSHSTASAHSSSSGGASSSSSSSSSSSGGAGGAGGTGGALFYPEEFGFNHGQIDPGFNPAYHNLGGGGGSGGHGHPGLNPGSHNLGGGASGGGGHGQSHSFASSSSSSSSGLPGFGGFGGHGGADNLGYDGPILFSRIGEDTGTGVKVSGRAQGPKAAFSSSSSSIDSDGKIKYSVKSGKY